MQGPDWEKAWVWEAVTAVTKVVLMEQEGIVFVLNAGQKLLISKG